MLAVLAQPVLTAAVNRLLDRQPHLGRQLAAHGGRSVALQAGPLRLVWRIGAEGGLVAAAGEADATLRLAPLRLAALALDGQEARHAVSFAGDGRLAVDAARVFAALDPQAEEALSRLVGDAAARRLADGLRRLAGTGRGQLERLGGLLAEHLTEEARALAPAAAVERFCADVDRLRLDAERLDKRLRRLSAAVAGDPPSP